MRRREKAIHQAEDEAWLAEFNASFAAPRAGPEASAEYDAELAEWDAVLLDGLEEEE
jgi:hypothetical protein